MRWAEPREYFNPAFELELELELELDLELGLELEVGSELKTADKSRNGKQGSKHNPCQVGRESQNPAQNPGRIPKNPKKDLMPPSPQVTKWNQQCGWR